MPLGRPLRVAIFSDSALPVLNGVSISIDALIQGLRERGHSVHLFTVGSFGYQDPDPNTHRFLALPTPWTKGYPLAIPPFYPMLRHFRQIDFDLVHTHTPFTVGFVGLRWAQSHELPIVSTYHTLYDKYIHYMPFFPKRYMRFKLAKHTNFYYNQIDQVITPSEASRKWLIRHSVKKPISVIPTGIPARRSLERSVAREKLDIAPTHKILLYVGRIAREKNLRTLLEMAAFAFAQDPLLRLLIVGDGPGRAELSQMACDLGIGDRVKFAGFVPRSEVDLYYAAADLFVFSSMTETQGLVVGEAMSYGLPAIVVQGGGAGAAVESGVNGFTVPNNPRFMANKVLDVLGNELLQARLSQGALNSSADLSESASMDRVLQVYHQVLLDKSGKREFAYALP